MNFWRQMVTGVDNATVDHARVITIGVALVWAGGVVTFLALVAMDYAQTLRFSPRDFAYSFGALIGSGASIVTLAGAGIALKANTEPKARGDAT